jgi:hypothetical protein
LNEIVHVAGRDSQAADEPSNIRRVSVEKETQSLEIALRNSGKNIGIALPGVVSRRDLHRARRGLLSSVQRN